MKAKKITKKWLISLPQIKKYEAYKNLYGFEHVTINLHGNEIDVMVGGEIFLVKLNYEHELRDLFFAITRTKLIDKQLISA